MERSTETTPKERMSHTPGPWIIGKSYTDDIAIREVDGMECIATALPTEPDEQAGKEEQLANARLIAAAPAMLEALRELVAEAPPREKSPGLDKAHAIFAIIDKGEMEK